MWTVVDVGWVWTACGSMALECETEFGGLHETPAVNGIVNEHANGSESEMEIKNEIF
jgi:hypothetical protein